MAVEYCRLLFTVMEEEIIYGVLLTLDVLWPEI